MLVMKYDGDYDEFIEGNQADEHIATVSGMFGCDSDSLQITISQGSVIIEYIFDVDIENEVA